MYIMAETGWIDTAGTEWSRAHQEGMQRAAAGDAEEALRLFEQARHAAATPLELATTAYEEAGVLLQLERWQDAARALQACLAAAPDSPIAARAYLALGRLFERQGRTEEAALAYRGAIGSAGEDRAVGREAFERMSALVDRQRTQAPGAQEQLLVQRIQAADLRALRIVVRSFQHRLARYLALLTGDAARAAALTRETFVELYQRILALEYNPDVGLRLWLFRLATQRAAAPTPAHALLRRMTRQVPLPWLAEWLERLVPAQTSPPPGSGLDEDDRLRRVLAALPIEQAALLLLSALEGLRYHELALVLDIPVEAVPHRMLAARQALEQAAIAAGVTFDPPAAGTGQP
jgi:RNA polymerase sigma-70 factor (ECF subfamily)